MEMVIDFANYSPLKSKEKILEDLSPKDIDIQVDVFEEIILQDIAMGDDRIKIKLARNLTKEFKSWIRKKILAKEQIKINIRGETRCFDKETLVLTKNGYKKICEIDLNDEVYSLNEKTKNLELKKVLNVFEYKQKRQDLVKFIMKDGLIISTYGHEFYKNGEWIKNYEFRKRILGRSPKFKWQLFCEQLRAIKNSELEKLQKRTSNETCFRWKWLSKNYDLSKWKNKDYKNSSINCTTFHKKSFQQKRSKSQRLQQNKQSSIKFRVGNTSRKFRPYDEKQFTIENLWFKKWKFSSFGKNCKKNSPRVYSTKNNFKTFSKEIQYQSWNNKIYPLQRVEAFEINENNILDIEIYNDIIDVYDLEVEDNHNYIITENNIIVHNSGKSQIGVRILFMINEIYKELGMIKDFDAEKVICANQKELRTKLNVVEFADFFQIDENAFANVGSGSHTEMQQLKDINNIVAKENIQMIYITPQIFLPTGATTGLSYFGKDTTNWVSRFLLYSLKGTIPSLLGYVVFDVGKNFSDNGCLVYRQLGGCTNPKRLKIEQINQDTIFHSSCIDKSKLTSEHILNDGKTCPFYNICNSFNCQYEHKKDKWIARELKGGIGEREAEKIEVALKIFEEFAMFNPDKAQFRLNAKNGKELKLKIKNRLPFIINTKYTGVEVEDIIQMIISLLDMQFLEDTAKLVELDSKEILQRIQNKDKIENEKIIEKKKEEKKETQKTLDEIRDNVKQVYEVGDDTILSIVRKDPKLYYDLIKYAEQIVEEKAKKSNEETPIQIEETKENIDDNDESNNEKV